MGREHPHASRAHLDVEAIPRKYNDPIIKILLVAAAISLGLAVIENDYVEAIGIFLAIFFATTVGFYFERDAADDSRNSRHWARNNP